MDGIIFEIIVFLAIIGGCCNAIMNCNDTRRFEKQQRANGLRKRWKSTQSGHTEWWEPDPNAKPQKQKKRKLHRKQITHTTAVSTKEANKMLNERNHNA